MFDTEYQAQTHRMQGVLDPRGTVSDISYKLLHDHNVMAYLRHAVTYARVGGDRDAMSWNAYYLVTSEADNIMRLMHLFINTLLHRHEDEGVDSDTLAQPRRLYPDSTGESILRLLGFMPLLELIHEHIAYHDLVSQYDSDGVLGSMAEQQEVSLFSDDPYSMVPKFPDASHFVDYALRNRYIDKIKKEYLTRMPDLLEHMQLAASLLHDDPTPGNPNALKAGKAYWDAKSDARQQQNQDLRDGLAAVMSGLKGKS